MSKKTKKKSRSHKPKARTRIYLRGSYWHIYYRSNGTTVQKSLKTTSKKLALEIQKRKEAELLTDQGQPVESVSVSDLKLAFDSWLQANNRRAQTIYQHDWSARHFFSAIPKSNVRDFLPEDVEEFKRIAAERGLTPPSVNSVLRHVRAMFGQAHRWGFIQKNPLERCVMLREERKIPEFIPLEDVRILLGYLRNHPPYDLVSCLAVLCGFRVSEIGGALWSWFDWKERTVTLSPRDDFHLKDWESRTVPLSDSAISILEPKKKSSGYVITFSEYQSGKPMERISSRAYFQRWWERNVSDHVFPGVTILQLRKTFGSLHLQAGTNLSKIALWMGHSSEDVTRKHYAALLAYDQDIERVKF